MSAAKIKKGDRVVVLSGKDKGKHGEVVRAMPKDGKVIVSGVNVVVRHTKPSQADPQGGLKRKEAPIHVSKVAIEDPKTGKPTRVGFRIENGQKVRVAKRSGEVING
jgi:large subunit ribosomal protein L24